jgi:excisionase family DNA binding protein
MKDEPLSLSQVGAQLGLSAKTVRALIRVGELPAFRPGIRNLKVMQSDVDEFKDRRTRSLRHEYDSKILEEVHKQLPRR